MRRSAAFAGAMAFVYAVCLSASVALAEWGNLKGRFIYTGEPPKPRVVQVANGINVIDESLMVSEDGGLKNVLVWVRTKDVDVHLNFNQMNPHVKLEVRNLRFEPHVLPMDSWQTLEICNADRVAHNPNMQPLGDAGINPLLHPNAGFLYQFRKPQVAPVPVSCNIHSWERAYVFPHHNPYVTVSADDGTFEIKNMPARELEIQIWHERTGYLGAPGWAKGRKNIVIPANGSMDLGDIRLPPNLF